MEYVSHEDEWNFAIYNNMEGIKLGEISQKKRNSVCFDLYVESKKNETNEWIYQIQNRLISTENKLVITSGEKDRRGENRRRELRDTNY